MLFIITFVNEFFLIDLRSKQLNEQTRTRDRIRWAASLPRRPPAVVLAEQRRVERRRMDAVIRTNATNARVKRCPWKPVQQNERNLFTLPVGGAYKLKYFYYVYLILTTCITTLGCSCHGRMLDIGLYCRMRERNRSMDTSRKHMVDISLVWNLYILSSEHDCT